MLHLCFNVAVFCSMFMQYEQEVLPYEEKDIRLCKYVLQIGGVSLLN